MFVLKTGVFEQYEAVVLVSGDSELGLKFATTMNSAELSDSLGTESVPLKVYASRRLQERSRSSEDRFPLDWCLCRGFIIVSPYASPTAVKRLQSIS